MIELSIPFVKLAQLSQRITLQSTIMNLFSHFQGTLRGFLGALQQTTNEVSQTISSTLGQAGISSVASHPTNESQGVTNVVQTFGVIRIIFRLP